MSPSILISGASVAYRFAKAIFGPIGSAVSKVMPSGDDDFELPSFRFDADSSGTA